MLYILWELEDFLARVDGFRNRINIRRRFIAVAKRSVENVMFVERYWPYE